MLRFEHIAWKAGCSCVAGLDEAGRGPLAGPVVAAVVTMDRGFLEAEEHGCFAGLTDSKKLTPARRDHFFSLLRDGPAVTFGVGRVEPGEIDRINILKATHLAMRLAMEDLERDMDHVLVDGRPVPGLPCPSTAIVGGDRHSLLIAAASVVAKVTRDGIMERLDKEYPGYGFVRHKGYGTREHLDALQRLGPMPCHRRSFRPVRQLELRFSQPETRNA